MSDTALFVEERIIQAVSSLMTGRVNELLEDRADHIPPLDFSGGPGAVCPKIGLALGDRSEKDRIIKVDGYVLTITLIVPELDGERNCYAYAALVEQALREDVTLGGAVDRAVLADKQYTPPKIPYCGDGWEAVFTLRITVEGMAL
ncbi:hypothetical protein FACS1894130_11180 [Spirochaetia bacterium]|nr:hypothetical protein FACS1894130_11180 [Spirochaetia bacterium]